MIKEYRTIAAEASAEIEEKKSRFIATVRPVSSEDEAVAFINEIKTKYWNATHNVYAYYICGDNIYQKFSDDGEPSGTAGLPVLEAIKKLMVQDIVVVITRYFGGTLLGTAGLVRAYGKSATQGIEAAGIIIRQLCIETDIAMEYTLYGRIQSIVAAKGYRVKNTEYGQDVSMTVFVPIDEFEGFASDIIEASNARAAIIAGDKGYITLGA